MTHGPHKGNPRQLLDDSCAACVNNGREVHVVIASLDEARFAAAWKRAAAWQAGQLAARDKPVSDAETPALRALWALAQQLERRGFPVGQVPTW